MTAVEDVASVEVVAQTAASDVAASLRTRSSKSLQTRPWDERRGRRLCRRGCTRRPLGMSHLMDEAAGWLRCYRYSDAMRHACKLLHGKICSAVTWPRSPFASVDAAGATVKFHTSSCTPLVQLSLDLSVPNHSEHGRNSFPHFLLANQGRRTLPQQLFSRLKCFYTQEEEICSKNY